MMTKEGIYVPSILEDLETTFKKYCSNKAFLDLGSGNGKVLGLAFKHNSIIRGAEIDKEFYDNAEFRRWTDNKDLFEMDFEIYNILYYFMKGCNQEDRLIEKLNKEGQEILILYTNGSNDNEIEYFTNKLNAKRIDSFRNVLIYRFKTQYINENTDK